MYYHKQFNQTLINVLFAVILLCMIISSVAWWCAHTGIFYLLYFRLTRSFLYSLLFILALSSVIIGICYAIHQYYKRRGVLFSAGEMHKLLVIMLRYWLAFELAVYGFAKYFERFFVPFVYRNDVPAGALGGVDIAWYFFGYSHNLSMIVAWLQIIGGLLMLFKRTTLSGIVILLPVTLYIVLINFCYITIPLAKLNSIFITLALVYLLMLRWQEIKHILFAPHFQKPVFDVLSIKWLARLIVVGGAFAGVYFFMARQDKTPISGKWKVEKLVRNGVPVHQNAWLTDKYAWKNIYLEDIEIELSPNPYIFDSKRAVHGIYKYDAAKKTVSLQIFNKQFPAKAAFARVQNFGNKKMIWDTVLGNDTLHFELAKVESRHY